METLKFGKMHPFAISISDGHNEDWEYFTTEEEATKRFNSLKEAETDLHLHKFNSCIDSGVYEVVDCYYDEDFANN